MRIPVILAGLVLTSPAISAEIRTLDVFDFAAEPGEHYMFRYDLSGFYRVELDISRVLITGTARCYLRFFTDDGIDRTEGHYDYFSQGLLAGTAGKPELDTNSSAITTITDRIVLQDSENNPMSPIHGQITILDPGDAGPRRAVEAWILANDTNGRMVGERVYGIYTGEQPLRGLDFFCGDKLISGRIIVTGYSLQLPHDNATADDVTAQIEPLTPTRP